MARKNVEEENEIEESDDPVSSDSHVSESDSDTDSVEVSVAYAPRFVLSQFSQFLGFRV